MPNRYDLIDCWDDQYGSVEDYYLSKLAKLDIVSPTFDGTSPQRAVLSVRVLLTKADLTSADTGAVNTIYSLGVFIQYLTQANALGALPKRPWRRQGYRAVKTAAKTSAVGIAEAAALGTAVEPVYFEVGPTPKEIELVSSYSARLAVLSQIADAVTVDQNRQVIERDFFRSLDKDLNGDATTVAGNNFESLDRVASKDGQQGIDAGDEDLYGVDRSVETWFNAYVNDAATNRTLGIELIDSLRENLEPRWESFPDEKYFQTGFDTWGRMGRLIGSQQRFTIEDVSFTVGDGIRTSPGMRTGFRIAAMDGIPVIRDDQTFQTASELSNLHLWDTSMDRLGIAWGRPVEYMEKDDPFVVGHVVKGMWYGIGEVFATYPRSSGKLRDIV